MLFAVFSICGLISCIVVYTLTIRGHSVDDLFPLFAVFLVGALAVNVPIYQRENSAAGMPLFFWSGLVERMPRWVFRGEAVLIVIAIAHVAWFAAHSGFGVPEIVNGRYVIDDHGRILKELTEDQYFSLRGAALRMTMTIAAVLYFLPATYWFLRSRKTETA